MCVCEKEPHTCGSEATQECASCKQQPSRSCGTRLETIEVKSLIYIQKVFARTAPFQAEVAYSHYILK